MFQSTAAKKAIQSLPRARRFSTTPVPAAISPYRKHSPQTQTQQQQQPSRRNVSDTATRSAQAATATSPQRAVPSPAFNRDEKIRDVQPLQPFRQPEMDHSFVGMTGGEIFHEMMLRQGVKHVCTYNNTNDKDLHFDAAALTMCTSWVSRWCYLACIRCHIQQRQVRLHPPET